MKDTGPPSEKMCTLAEEAPTTVRLNCLVIESAGEPLSVALMVSATEAAEILSADFRVRIPDEASMAAMSWGVEDKMTKEKVCLASSSFNETSAIFVSAAATEAMLDSGSMTKQK